MPVDDRRTRKTRRAIDEACWVLLKEKNFDDISVADIADRADINRATFYRYYADKFDWLEHQLKILMGDQESICEKIYSTEDPVGQHEAFVESYRHFERNFDIYHTLISNKSGRIFLEWFTEIQMDLLKKVLFHNRQPSVTEDFYIHFVAISVAGILKWWIENNCPIPVEELAEKMLSIHRHIPLYAHSHAE